MRLPSAVLLPLALSLAGCPRGIDTGDTADTADTADTGADTSDTGADTSDTGTARRIRVVTWNIEGVGDDAQISGSTLWDDYAAAVKVLQRLDADVVCINEVTSASDASALADLADDLGFATYYSPPNTINPNQFQRNGLLTRLPVENGPVAFTSAELSGDADADDLTRLPLSVTVDLPGETEHLTVVCQHWKSGFDDVDEFRRVIDSHRTVQAAQQAESDWVLVAGDVNAEVTDPIESPNPFTSVPSGLPNGYFVGADLYADLTDANGLANNPFAAFDAAGFDVAEARQQDGTSYATRNSGRRIDYIFVGADVPSGWQAEVFDCVDDAAGLAGVLPKAGDPVAANACGQASDHLPVILDLP